MSRSSLAALTLISVPLAWIGGSAGQARAEEALPAAAVVAQSGSGADTELDPMTPEPEGQGPKGPETASTDPADDWRGTVEIYGFAPLRNRGSVTIRGFESDYDDDLGDLLSDLDWYTAVRGNIEKGRWGLLADLSYVKLSNTAGTTDQRGRFTGETKITSEQGIYDVALRYRVGDPESALNEPGGFSFIPYAGIRVMDVNMDVRARVRQVNGNQRLGAERSFGRTWVQPLVGFQASYFLSPRLRAFARADIGGFDFSGAKDYSGNAQLGLGYAVGNNTDITLSWRYLGINYNNGKVRDGGIRSYQNGIEMGVKFFF